MIDSINNFFYIILGIVGLVVAWVALAFGLSFLIYLTPLFLVLLSISLFLQGGALGTFGIFLGIGSILSAYSLYIKCEKCGLSFKYFKFDSAKPFGFEAKCIRCRNKED